MSQLILPPQLLIHPHSVIKLKPRPVLVVQWGACLTILDFSQHELY